MNIPNDHISKTIQFLKLTLNFDAKEDETIKFEGNHLKKLISDIFNIINGTVSTTIKIS